VLSVIVPYSGAGRLEPLFSSLAAQTLDQHEWELILVSESEHANATRAAFPKRVVREVHMPRDAAFQGHTAPRLRNAGARKAQGRWLLFIDSDCVLDRDCLRRHLELQRHLARDGAVAVCGAIRELPATHLALLSEAAPYESLASVSIADYRAGRNDSSAHFDDFYSGNASLPAELFERAGGFDERGFRCHDVELGYRLSRLGARFHYEAGCEAIHIEHPRVAASRLEQAEGWRRLAETFPELRAISDDRILIARRAYERAVQSAESAFVVLTQQLPGARFGTVWLCPPGTPENALTLNVPHVRRTCRSTVQYFLRLDRNCWDYSILLPSGAAPVVTVAIPANEAAATIGRAIQSVLVQTLQELEIVVVDDGSTDDTARAARDATADARLRVLTLSENCGQSAALNRALDAATTPYILHLDADDTLEPQALEMMIAALDTNPQSVAAYANPIIHASDRKVSRLRAYPVTNATEIVAHRPPQVPRVYRCDALRAIGGWSTDDPAKGRYYEDRWTLSRILARGRVQHVDAWLYNVHQSADSLGNSGETRFAKFAILTSEANRISKSVSIVGTRGFLRAELIERRSTPPAEPWSVVIPFRDRHDLLAFTINSWLQSDWMTSGSELIIVDDGSLMPACAEELGDRIRVIRSEHSRGPAWARNRGAREARYGMLLFGDCDHVVPPDILGVHQHYHDHADGPAVVVGGAFGRRGFTTLRRDGIDPVRVERFLSVIRNHERFSEIAAAFATDSEIAIIDHKSADLWMQLAPYTYIDEAQLRWASMYLRYGRALTEYPLRWLRVGGANVSVSAEAFARLKGFDESLWSAEDWDFGARAVGAGMGILSALEAETYHQVHAPDSERARTDVEGRKAILRKHPVLTAQVAHMPISERPPHLDLLDPAPRRKKHVVHDAAPPFLALTFDDGPASNGTPATLELLREHGARATFFVIGKNARTYPKLMRAIVEQGHEIGVHGWNHSDPLQMTTNEIVRALAKAVRFIEEVAGVTPRYVRPAYGHLTPSMSVAAARVGLTPVQWHLSPRDWGQDGWKEQVRRLAVAGLRGKVVLLHDGAREPEELAKTLAWLLRTARSRELDLLTISEYAARLPLPDDSHV